jgi:hypothetical protein
VSLFIETLSVVPALLFLGRGLFCILKFNSLQKKLPFPRKVLTTFLGPLALASKTLMDPESKKALSGFYVSGFWFVICLLAFPALFYFLFAR